MSRLALPEGDAQRIAVQQQRQNQITGMRFEIAKEVMANLMPVEYHRALNQAHNEADPFDTKDAASDDEEGREELHLQFDVGCVARVSVAAADALLTVMGIIQPPPKPSINNGPR